MKYFISAFFVLLFQLSSAQYVTLSKAEKAITNNDKFFYKIDPEKTQTQYLGEIEVQGFSKNDPEVFNQIYKKAKTIGANTFSLKKKEDIDGSFAKFDPAHYFINVYYTKELPKENNTFYLFSSSEKAQKVKINGKALEIQPRSHLRVSINSGETVSVSSGGFLGSKIVLAYKEQQPVQYFLVLSGGIRADYSGNQGGLNLKSGDIISVEKSYANFLSAIYHNQNF